MADAVKRLELWDEVAMMICFHSIGSPPTPKYPLNPNFPARALLLKSTRAVPGRRCPHSAQCVLCKVRCHCIFYGPGIRYSDIFCVPCISSGYSDIFWHISVVNTVAYFRGNHGSRFWKSLKLKMYFPRTRTSWDKYIATLPSGCRKTTCALPCSASGSTSRGKHHTWSRWPQAPT